MPVNVTQAMILAAGLGIRMRPLTDTLPKPLIEVCGRTLIDRALDRLIAAGVRRAVVNSHYLGDRLEAHLAARSDIAISISRETALLETGGAIVNALPFLANLPFFVVNADSFWTDGTVSSLGRLATAFDPARMDALLMLHRTTTAFGYHGAGDYFADPLGRIRRRCEGQVAPYAYAGVHILTKMAVAAEKRERFSLVRVWDRLQDAERLYGQIHDGLWFHVATPEDLTKTEEYCRTRRLFS